MIAHNNRSEITSPVDYSGLTFLLVDDEELNILLLGEYLDETGAVLITARNGLEAVRKCKEVPGIQLILMDIRMPVMNGIEATRQIKAFLSVPVIAVSAFPQSLEKKRTACAGFNDFIEKPFTQQKIFEGINKQLNPAYQG